MQKKAGHPLLDSEVSSTSDEGSGDEAPDGQRPVHSSSKTSSAGKPDKDTAKRMRELSSDSEVEVEEPPQKRKQRRVVESDSEPDRSQAASDSPALGILTSETEQTAALSAAGAVADGARRAVLEEHSYAASGFSTPNALTVLQNAAAEAAAANAAASNKFIDPKKKRRCFLIHYV